MSSVTITIITESGRIDVVETAGYRVSAALPLGRAVGRAMGALRPEMDEAAIMFKQVHHALRDAGLLPRGDEEQP